MAFVACFLSACASSYHAASLAPPPPLVDESVLRADMSDQEKAYLMLHYAGAQGSAMSEAQNVPDGSGAVLAMADKGGAAALAGCNIKDRFDRGAALAYEWGEGRRNRLAFDVGGLKLSPFGGSSAKIDEVKVSFRFKLQNWESKKEKCRGEANWQGIVGSGYRELFLRENDTVWQQLGDFQRKLTE